MALTLKICIMQLTALTAWRNRTAVFKTRCHSCRIRGQDAARFEGVPAHGPALPHLNLIGNETGAKGAESFAGVLKRKDEGNI
jgi:hypothetical protein